jgi:drug/metabolite transporter (DMT)-like permease
VSLLILIQNEILGIGAYIMHRKHPFLSLKTIDHKKAILLLIITALLWSTGGLLIKFVSWNPIAIAGGRSAVAAILLLIVIRRPRLKWSLPFIFGAFMYAGTVILFVCSNKMTTAANAILLQYTAPIYIAIFGGLILKEKTTSLDWIIIGIVMGGMVLFFLDDLKSGNLWGNVLAILSGVCFAFLVICMRKQKSESPLQSIFWGNVLTALIGIPFMLGGIPNKSGILGILILGIFQLGLSYILYSSAIKHVTAIEGILIPIIEPVFNPVFVLIAYGEIPGFYSIIGGVIIVSAIVFRGVLWIQYNHTPNHSPVIQKQPKEKITII